MQSVFGIIILRWRHFGKSIFFGCHMRNSNFLGVSITSTWNSTCSFLGFAPSSILTCIFPWELLSTLYIMRLWALILYHVIWAIVLEETLQNCIHYLQYNTTVFGVNRDVVLLLAHVVNSWLVVMLLLVSSCHCFFHACFKLC